MAPDAAGSAGPTSLSRLSAGRSWLNLGMDVSGLLLDLYGRIPPLVEEAVQGLDPELLTRAPSPGANTIAWLAWHVGRVEDHQISELRGEEQLWAGGDWARRFGLEPDPNDTGYGHSREQAAAVRPQAPEVLLEYVHAADARTRRFLEGLTGGDLDRIVDERWDPPVTMGVRLVSIADDCIQHAGQAAYLRGLFGA